ncbi:MAG: hypothetical protein ICV52_08525, partial [Microcoleus sp. C1-bin4]|nr:hypothetical protein [Microcoleus sp. C1-bin4]
NNAYGSYKEKGGQTLEQFANAVDSIGRYEGFKVVDLYHKKEMDVKHLVKFKRLKDTTTGNYKNYNYNRTYAATLHNIGGALRYANTPYR